MDESRAFDPLTEVTRLAALAGQPVEEFLADAAATHARRQSHPPPSGGDGGALYQRLEHAGGLRRIAAGLYERVLDDPRLVGFFKHLTDHGMRWLRWHLLTFLAVVTGGPNRHEGRDLRAAHADLHITREAFDRLCVHLDEVMTTLGVSAVDRAAVLATVRTYRPEIVAFERPRAWLGG